MRTPATHRNARAGCDRPLAFAESDAVAAWPGYPPGMTESLLRITSVSIASPDPRTHADFYARLLGVDVTETDPPRPDGPPESGWAQIRATPGVGMTLNFEFDPAYEPPTWPSEPGEQQIQAHLDIAVDDLAAGCEHALAAGATLLEFQPQRDVRVLRDPTGHLFCLFS